MNIAPYLDRAFSFGRNVVDTAVEVLSPRRAFENRLYRQQLTELSRLAANPDGAWKQAGPADTASSESQRGQRERTQIMWEAREVIQNFGFAKSIVSKFAKYVTGQMIYQGDTDDNGVNSAYEDYIWEWMENCDLTGRFHFRKLIEMAYLGRKIDGDSGILTPWVDGDIKLQVIQGDRIGNPYEYNYADGYYSGVITDSYGRVIGFRVFRRTRDGRYIEPMDVPAANFHHLINPLAADQYRGISDFDTAIPSARMVANTLNAEARAVQTLACQTAIVSTKGNIEGAKRMWAQNDVEAAMNAAKSPVTQNQEIKPGTINYVANGDSVTAFTYSRPSPAFLGLIQALCREVCFSLDVDYGFFYDPTSYGGAVARLGSKQTQRSFQADQRDLKDGTFCPLIRKKLALGIARGDIPPHPQWRKMQIGFPEHATMDEGRDSKKDIEELKYGVTLLDEVIGRSGGNLDNHLDRAGRIARKVLDVAKQYDVPVTMIQQRTPNANEEDPGVAQEGAAQKKSEAADNEQTELAALRREVTELREYVRDNKGRFSSSGATRGAAKSGRIFFDPTGDGKKKPRGKRKSYSRKQFRAALRYALTAAALVGAAHVGASAVAAIPQSPASPATGPIIDI